MQKNISGSKRKNNSIQTEEEKEEKNENNLRDLLDNINQTNICIIGVPEEEKREKGKEYLFK